MEILLKRRRVLKDPRVRNWPLMRTPFPTLAMVAAYVFFVKVAGPHFMKKRRPFELRTAMVIFNFIMVLFNFLIFFQLGWYGWFTNYSLKCQPIDYSNEYGAVKMAEIIWWGVILKFMEFGDTIFFVLRKKDNQISYVHVLHHSVVPVFAWIGMKYTAGGYASFTPFINFFVHFVLYLYYGLAALGENYKPYLFWKKHLIYFQLGQFVILAAFFISLMVIECEVNMFIVMLNVAMPLLFLGLFLRLFFLDYFSKSPNRLQIPNICQLQTQGDTEYAD